MNDRYLFRGRAIHDYDARVNMGEWVTGRLSQCLSEISAIRTEIDGEFVSIRVETASLGLCSGIPAAKSYRGTSRHDLLIFEADVIIFGGEIYEIIFADACFWISQGDYSMELHTLLGQGDIEIIGNVHDKPTGASL